jgi:YVTN family beta-propeller protein
MKTHPLVFGGLLASLAFAVLSPLRGESAYHFIKAIPVASDGGWDYLSVDSAARRLYVAHATRVVVIDLDRDAVVGEIADTAGVHGFAIAPELGRGFASNGKENTVSIVDLKTLKTLSKVSTGENPDAVFYEPSRKEVYAFNGRGKSVTVFVVLVLVLLFRPNGLFGEAITQSRV